MPSQKRISGKDRPRNTLIGGVLDAFPKANKMKRTLKTKERFDGGNCSNLPRIEEKDGTDQETFG